MKKVNAKRVLKRAKAKGARDWTIVSFSLDSGALKAFKAACKSQGVKGSAVIEEFMREFSLLNKGS